jgi:hypothetical protein
MTTTAADEETVRAATVPNMTAQLSAMDMTARDMMANFAGRADAMAAEVRTWEEFTDNYGGPDGESMTEPPLVLRHLARLAEDLREASREAHASYAYTLNLGPDEDQADDAEPLAGSSPAQRMADARIQQAQQRKSELATIYGPGPAAE